MKKNFKENIILGIVIILIDQIIKIIMIDKYITIIPNFLNFTYTMNKGAAFGIGTPMIILAINIMLILIAIVIIIKFKNKITNYIPITMMLAGGIGNLIDRIFRGFVIDYIDINLFNFPNFNIADIAIVFGILIIAYEVIKKDLKNTVKE